MSGVRFACKRPDGLLTVVDVLPANGVLSCDSSQVGKCRGAAEENTLVLVLLDIIQQVAYTAQDDVAPDAGVGVLKDLAGLVPR